MIQHITEEWTKTVVPCRPAGQAGTLAVVLRAFEGGGAERDVILLSNALVAKGMPVTIFVLHNRGPLRSLLDPAVKVMEIAGGRMRYAIPGLRRLIRAAAPRYVLSSESSFNLLSLAAIRTLPRAERPKVLMREVCSPTPAQNSDPYWQNRLSYRILRRCFRFADRIITLTEGARRDLVDNFAVPSNQVSAMWSNAVLTPEFSNRIARWDGEEGRDPNLIVSVGRLSKEKNHRLLIEALAILGTNRPWHLALVGDGAERAALEDYVREKGLTHRTTFVGYANDPFVWMMRAQVSVCSSQYEGLCNAIIEALGCGTPVVSTDCPYGPREILQNGRYGTLVPVGDAPALAVAIGDALDRPVDRNSLMERGFNYTADRAAESFLEIVAKL